MKVILGCLNSKYIHASLAPWCLKAGVDTYCKADTNVIVLESTINSDLDEYIDVIINEKPDVVCFSCYIWNIEKTLCICKKLKYSLNCKIILGGPEVSYRAQNVLQNYDFIDFVLSGEGEESLPKLIDILYFNQDLKNAYGLTYRKNDKLLQTDEKVYTGTPVSPYTDEFFENLRGRICYIETSRGCPYKCAFCLSGRCSPLRFFDMDIVKENILKLSNSGTKTVKFVDRTFNANPKRANEILLFILSNYKSAIPTGVCFHFEIAGDILTEETFALLQSAPKGLFQLEIGMQSFNEDTLKTINRKTNTTRLKENIKRLVSFGNMHIHIDLIAGLTGENMQSFENSFDIGFSLKPNMLQLGFLKLLYGADMRENPEKYPCEYSDKPPYEVTSTPWLTAGEIVKIKKGEDALERLYNSGKFLYTVEYLLTDCGFTPFKLFMNFGNHVDGTKMPLSQYALHIFDYFKTRADEDILKENIVCDMMESGCSSHIPKSFLIYSPIHKKIKQYFADGNYKIAIFEKSNKVFVVNQNGDKNLFGRVEGKFYPLENFVQ
ncbi:MAG: DUF4080 domain-containing protein [Clostridia bacterium]|nr:DUF4080 domain-containing protein [Clostridia bacterium]